MTDILSLQERDELKLCLENGQRQALAPRLRRESNDALANCVDRRAFLRGGAALVGTALASTFPNAINRNAYAATNGRSSSYGPVAPAIDEVTGRPLILLPPGFKYWSYGWTGDPVHFPVSRQPAGQASDDEGHW